MRPVPDIVSYFVGLVVCWPEPPASLKSNDLQTCARQWKYGESSGRTQANHHHVSLR
jgi:hypothetical protein